MLTPDGGNDDTAILAVTMEPVEEPRRLPGAGGRSRRLATTSGVRVVELVGEIDISNADALGEKLDRMVGDGNERLVVDLVGARVHGQLGHRDAAAGGRARRSRSTVRNPTPVVRRIIECTGLADILRIEP